MGWVLGFLGLRALGVRGVLGFLGFWFLGFRVEGVLRFLGFLGLQVLGVLGVLQFLKVLRFFGCSLSSWGFGLPPPTKAPVQQKQMKVIDIVWEGSLTKMEVAKPLPASLPRPRTLQAPHP